MIVEMSNKNILTLRQPVTALNRNFTSLRLWDVCGTKAIAVYLAEAELTSVTEIWLFQILKALWDA